MSHQLWQDTLLLLLHILQLSRSRLRLSCSSSAWLALLSAASARKQAKPQGNKRAVTFTGGGFVYTLGSVGLHQALSILSISLFAQATASSQVAATRSSPRWLAYIPSQSSAFTTFGGHVCIFRYLKSRRQTTAVAT